MDCFKDPFARSVLPKLQTNQALLDLVKTADINPSLSQTLPDSAFADRTRRELPVHTAAHAALSRLYLAHNPNLDARVADEVREACSAYGIAEDLFSEPQAKVAAAPDPQDFLFPDDGKIRIVTVSEVQRAGEKLASEGHRLFPGERVAAARRLRTKAATLGVTLPDTISRMAADAETDSRVLVEQLEARATVCKNASLSATFQNLADAVRGQALRPDDQVRLASALEELDAQAAIPNRYGILDAAASVYSGSVRKVASAMDLDLGASRLTGGAAAEIPPEMLGDVLGPDVMRDVAPAGQVDPQLLQQVISTLPRDIKEQLARMLSSRGVNITS